MTARELARVGAHVVLAVRNTAKGDDAAAGMAGNVEVRKLDLQDLASVHEFADGVSAVDVLVNNAGIMAVPYAVTKDGFESQIGTNHLGHLALTNLLLPKISDRVVTVSSMFHRMGRISLNDLNWKARPYRPWLAYAQSKLANLLFTSELQRRLDEVRLGRAGTGRPPRLLVDEPAGPRRRPLECRPAEHRRSNGPPTPTSAPDPPCSPHRRTCRATRCRPALWLPRPHSAGTTQPPGAATGDSQGAVGTVRAAHGHQISALTRSWANLGRTHGEGGVQPPLSTETFRVCFLPRRGNPTTCVQEQPHGQDALPTS